MPGSLRIKYCDSNCREKIKKKSLKLHFIQYHNIYVERHCAIYSCPNLIQLLDILVFKKKTNCLAEAKYSS